MKILLLIFLGGGTGSVLRYLIGKYTTCIALFGFTVAGFPAGTFIANILGCFLIGTFNSMAARYGMTEETRLMLTTGLCGGFTTFSTFSNESLAMLQSGSYLMFACYVGMSITVGILAAFLGSGV